MFLSFETKHFIYVLFEDYIFHFYDNDKPVIDYYPIPGQLEPYTKYSVDLEHYYKEIYDIVNRNIYKEIGVFNQNLIDKELHNLSIMIRKHKLERLLS